MSDQTEDPRLCDLMYHDAIVCRIMNAGGDVLDALQALSNERQRLLGELANAQSLAGRRYILPGGAELIWRPPDDALPVTDLSAGCYEPRPSDSHETILFMGHEYVRKEPAP
ncbi:MAG: hypothetical protein JW990_00175 [Thermoleophilia bacterium]|nr:hypothetical protein [Thermoleophilia bacterium]